MRRSKRCSRSAQIREVDSFVAFVPRKIATAKALAEAAIEQIVDVALPADGPTSPPAAPAIASPAPPDPGRAESAHECAPLHCSRADDVQENPFVREDWGFEFAVRTRAIELAIAATARALRAAAAADPKVIASFVDDAAAAAGDCAMERCRLNPEDVRCVEPAGRRVVGDPSIGPGGVMLEADGVRIGASVEERAELLVRREADA